MRGIQYIFNFNIYAAKKQYQSIKEAGLRAVIWTVT